MFAKAIARGVPATISAGITTAKLGKPDAGKAREQHRRYVAALEECGLEVSVLDADERYPDSVFVEDTAVVTDRCAIVTNPGAVERRGEVYEVEKTLTDLYGDVERITDPGTVDGGDVLQVGDHFYVGLTRRTNREGAEQLSAILRRYDFGVSFVELLRFLHLKTGVAYLGGDDLVVAGELVEKGAFCGFDKIVVPPEEEYGANCIRINERVLVAAGYETAKHSIAERGYEVIELEMSEFRKVDGGLSCLSLRLPGVKP
ncbi:MAG: arginine deiminase family protein [Actinomycetota bacterium]|nr:arginine deiminase family protein [Actinomycetota bacterium]